MCPLYRGKIPLGATAAGFCTVSRDVVFWVLFTFGDGSGSVWFEASPNENEPRKRPNVVGSLMTDRALVVRHGRARN